MATSSRLCCALCNSDTHRLPVADASLSQLRLSRLFRLVQHRGAARPQAQHAGGPLGWQHPQPNAAVPRAAFRPDTDAGTRIPYVRPVAQSASAGARVILTRLSLPDDNQGSIGGVLSPASPSCPLLQLDSLEAGPGTPDGGPRGGVQTDTGDRAAPRRARGSALYKGQRYCHGR
jgi:hypothetical protein